MTEPTPEERRALDDLARKAIEARNRAVAVNFLYCAAENMAGVMSARETIAELRKIAQHLEDYG